MADILFLELSRIGFQMELQRQCVADVGRCLIVIGVVRGEAYGTLRQINGRTPVTVHEEGLTRN
jgi:hypothetical protein